MRQVIEWLNALFSTVLAVAAFILIQLGSIYFFKLIGVDSSLLRGTFTVFYSVLVVFFFLIFIRLRQRKCEDLVKTTHPDLFSVLSSVVIGFGLLGIVTIYIDAAYFIADYFKPVEEGLNEYTTRIDRFSGVDAASVPYWDSIFDFIGTVLIVPLAEELVFRGVIFGELVRKIPPVLAAVFSSLIFGLLHGVSIHIGYAVLCGFILALVYYFSGSIWVSYMVHAVFNLVGSAFFTLLESGILGDYSNTLDTVALHTSVFEVVCIIPSIAALILLYKMGKLDDSNVSGLWSELKLRKEAVCE